VSGGIAQAIEDKEVIAHVRNEAKSASKSMRVSGLRPIRAAARPCEAAVVLLGARIIFFRRWGRPTVVAQAELQDLPPAVARATTDAVV